MPFVIILRRSRRNSREKINCQRITQWRASGCRRKWQNHALCSREYFSPYSSPYSSPIEQKINCYENHRFKVEVHQRNARINETMFGKITSITHGHCIKLTSTSDDPKRAFGQQPLVDRSIIIFPHIREWFNRCSHGKSAN